MSLAGNYAIILWILWVSIRKDLSSQKKNNERRQSSRRETRSGTCERRRNSTPATRDHSLQLYSEEEVRDLSSTHGGRDTRCRREKKERCHLVVTTTSLLSTSLLEMRDFLLHISQRERTNGECGCTTEEKELHLLCTLSKSRLLFKRMRVALWLN